MKLNQLKAAKNSTKTRKRVGRGPGSGTGKTSGRGHKGQKSRSGYSRRYGFEGGQMPLIRRIPKFGFKNIHKVIFQVVNVSCLNIFEDNANVTKESLKEKGLISKLSMPVKILGNGELEKKLNVKVDAVSMTAKNKIEEKGGFVEVNLG